MSRTLALLASLALAALLAARVPPPGEPATRHPEAPPETDQFAFLVGEWRCATRTMQPDGTLAAGPEASWVGYWILDGWAIQDDWTAPREDGSIVRGTNVRSYDPAARRWEVRWLAQGESTWKRYTAERVGETMVMTGGVGVDAAGRPYLDRNTFADIGPDAWTWRKDRSYDGGETWIEGVVRIEATRVR